MEAPYAVIADDLTGAGDTGVQFAHAGLRTRALLGEWDAAAVGGVDVVVLNTESRALGPAEAYQVVERTAVRLREAGVVPIYKKIDSTMRGNVGAEVEAVMDVFGLKLAVICPAFPANRRLVAGGYLLVDGQPVARTAIGRDPVAPVKMSSIPALLAAQCRRPVRHVGLDTLDQGREALRQALEPPAEGALAVVDAASEADLAAMVEALFDEPGVLFVGSAGLAAPLAERLAQRWRVEEAQAGDRRAPEAQPLVVVACGSVNPVTREQLDELVRSGNVTVLTVDVEAALRGGPAWDGWLQAARGQIRAAAARPGQALVVATPGGREDVEQAQQIGAGLGLEPAAVAGRLANALAETVIQMMDEIDLAGVIATGGDTARALFARLGAAGIDLNSEVFPGIPYGTLTGGSHPGLRVVTKAGGFGPRNALVEAVRYLESLPL